MTKNITKKDLVVDVAARTGVPENQVKEVIEAFMGQIIANLALNHSIEIRGFGTFHCQPRKGRPACNPRTKEIVRIPERLVPALRFCKRVRERVTIKEVD